jgi:Na+-transporting methylmalonyl-CoA/oxaloacetate decarboxylase gamma subunit
MSEELFQEALRLSAVGVGTVFTALIVTGLVVTLIGRLFKEKKPVSAAETAPLPDDALGGLDKHVIVLLAAAATAAVKRPVRIRRVTFVSHKHVPALWAAVGRVGRPDGSSR